MTPNWFIGLPVEAGPWFSQVTAGLPPGIRRFNPLDLHLTVAFLGGCTPAEAQAAWDGLLPNTHGVVHAQFADIKAMGKPSQPSAYSLTFSRGHEALADLMGTWRGPAYGAAGARPDTRDPLPHLTIARPARNADTAVRRAGLAWLTRQIIPPVTITINRIALYTWSDNRRERLFEIVEERPLDAPGP